MRSILNFKYLFLLVLIPLSLDSVMAETQEELMQRAQQSAKEITGQIQLEGPATNFDVSEEYAKYGVQEMNSTGSLLSSSTSLSATFTSDKEFRCKNGETVHLAYLRMTFIECHIGASVFNIDYCSSLDGRECTDSTVRNTSLTLGSLFTFDTDSSIKISSCSDSKCRIEVVHSPKDDFEGDLEAEAEERDSVAPSAATRAALNNLNSEFYDQAKAEADATADFMNRAMESVETTGEMPIYRNSPSDVTEFGNRAGSILIDAESLGNGEVCAQDPSEVETQTCNNLFQAAEFVCDQSPPICSYERVENIVRDCGRELTMTCDKILNCTTIDYLDYTGSLPSLNDQTSLILINRQYVQQGNQQTLLTDGSTHDYFVSFEDLGEGRFKLGNNRFGYDTNPARRTFEFELQIKDINKIESFIYEATQHEDFYTMLVNDTPVYTYPSVSGVASSCAPWRDFIKTSGPKTLKNLRATCTDGSTDNSKSGKWKDRSESVQSPNLNLKTHLRTGSNTIKMILGVAGNAGHIGATFKANFTAECDCAWTETWEDKPCAL